TGGAGFIGSNLVDALLDDDHEVTVVDDLSSGKEANLRDALARGVTLNRADVSEPEAMLEIFEGFKPEVVFHLAAQIDVRKSVADPVLDARINVGGTASVLEAARKTGARRLLFASTGGALYGDSDVIPTPEDSPIAPMAQYGTSKFSAEAYLGLYHRLYGLSTMALRFGNVYGPRQDPHGESGVIAIYCGRALEGRSATVFGDGRQTRDYVFVGDVVRAFQLAAGSDAVGSLNVGTAQETTVLELAHAIGIEPDFQPARTGEIQRSCLDVSRAAEVLGFRAEVGLEQGLERTLAAGRAA
nr:NAD-dependent epimerase/dehydratase family protein [Solirubrobacterales bacterium]